MNLISTELFSDVARNYAEHRPSYPEPVFQKLRDLVPTPARAVDIGAGTGIFSRGLLAAGYDTVSVEPNQEMRDQAASQSAGENYSVVAGSAEDTNLNSETADLVTIAQAFHWIKPLEARTEFNRIGKPGYYTAVVWNGRDFGASPFMQGYKELLLTYAPEYQTMKAHWNDLDKRVATFFAGQVEIMVT